MLNWLREDVVLYGLFRMGFGTGEFRRSKLVFLRWSGEATPAIERGKGNAVEEAMQEVLTPHPFLRSFCTRRGAAGRGDSAGQGHHH